MSESIDEKKDSEDKCFNCDDTGFYEGSDGRTWGCNNCEVRKKDSEERWTILKTNDEWKKLGIFIIRRTDKNTIEIKERELVQALNSLKNPKD